MERFLQQRNSRFGTFLPGILIGYVSEVEEDPNNLTKTGTLTPVVDFEHIREVLVIKELKQQKGDS